MLYDVTVIIDDGTEYQFSATELNLKNIFNDISVHGYTHNNGTITHYLPHRIFLITAKLVTLD